MTPNAKLFINEKRILLFMSNMSHLMCLARIPTSFYVLKMRIQTYEDSVPIKRGPFTRVQKNNPIENIIEDMNEGVITISKKPINYR